MSRNLSVGRLLSAARELDRSSQTDRDLLQEFVACGNEGAFEALVKRHSSMVMGVCTRSLPNGEDAEDACQAVFLILAKKASNKDWHPSIANWLYATARQVSRNFNRAARRSIATAKFRGSGASNPASLLDQMSARELLAALNDELDRLPDIYREPLILYHFENLSRSEAAARLGVGVDTLKTRLERGRKRLAAALTKRGVELGAALIAIAVTAPAHSVSPPLLRAILTNLTQQPASTIATVLARYEASSKAKLLVLAATALLGAGLSGIGAALMQAGALPPGPKIDSTKTADLGAETALKNEQVRLDCFGDPLPPNAVARLGSLRFFHGETIDQVKVSADGRWIA